LPSACPGCGRAASPDLAFCEGCGQALEVPASAAQPDPSAYTPQHLAQRILTQRSALEGERKQVTVLFADVKGSMDLAERVDPEEWHRILDRFFAILADGVHRYEGTINQYTGDGVMALFGAPIAHEDHAQRACRASLFLLDELRRYGQELRRNHGLDFNVRLGMNSGEVVVGRIGDDLRMDYTAQGATVGLAARMQQIAEPGRAYLSEATAQMVAGYFALEDLGEFKLKGVGVPARAWSLEGLGDMRTRLDHSRERGFSRFVGRELELAALEAGLASAADGASRVHGVVAQAGTGKSRLCHEFATLARAAGVPVFEAQAVAHGRHLPLMPILELLQRFFSISEQDSDRLAREKIAGRLLLLDPGLRDSLPLAFELMRVPDPQHPLPEREGALRQHEVFAFLRRIVRMAGSQGPVVVLIEDLHWLDPESEAFLHQLIEAAAGSHLMLLLNFRPGVEAEWMSRPDYESIELVPLVGAPLRELLDDLIGRDESVLELAGLIEERTGGNPFFVEEMVRALVDAGDLVGTRGSYQLVSRGGELSVPDTVQAILSARIDRLGETRKQVLQIGSVIGKRFDPELVAAVSGLSALELRTALADLTDAELVRPDPASQRGEYLFAHPLTQEVAYGSQLRERRAELHLGVADAIDRRSRERAAPPAALIAHHFEIGGAPLDAAQWLRRAAHLETGSNPEGARAHWRRVSTLLDELSGDEAADLALEAASNVLLLSLIAGITADEASAAYYRGRAIAEERGHREQLAALIALYGMIVGATTGELRTRVRMSREALELVRESEDAGAFLTVALMTATALFSSAELEEALALADEAIARWSAASAEPENNAFYLHVCEQRARIIGTRGQPQLGAKQLAELLPRAHERGLSTLEQLILGSRCALNEALGDVGALERDSEAARRIADATPAPMLQAYAHSMHGAASALRGDWQQSASDLELALERLEAGRTNMWDQPFFMARLAQALARTGETERARALAAGALERSRQLGLDVGFTSFAYARVLLAMGDASLQGEIEALLGEYASWIEAAGWRISLPALHLARADLAALRGDAVGRERELDVARTVLGELGAAAADIDRLVEAGRSPVSRAGG
jgi:class 3 adenylate cyclase/tetratricopeptide (TPR) repeat protein